MMQLIGSQMDKKKKMNALAIRYNDIWGRVKSFLKSAKISACGLAGFRTVKANLQMVTQLRVEAILLETCAR